jgi:hypothetical protein
LWLLCFNGKSLRCDKDKVVINMITLHWIGILRKKGGMMCTCKQMIKFVDYATLVKLNIPTLIGSINEQCWIWFVLKCCFLGSHFVRHFVTLNDIFRMANIDLWIQRHWNRVKRYVGLNTNKMPLDSLNDDFFKNPTWLNRVETRDRWFKWFLLLESSSLLLSEH